MSGTKFIYKEPPPRRLADLPFGIHRRRSHVSHEHVLNCVRCRYELLGLPPESTCPECGELKADTRVRVIDDPPEYSVSRLLVLLIAVSSLPILGWVAEQYWYWLYATSRWGARPNSSELSWGLFVFIGLFYFVFMVFPVSVLPWRMTRRQIVLATVPALFAMFALNMIALRSHWTTAGVELTAEYLVNVYGLLLFVCPPVNFLVAGFLFFQARKVEDEMMIQPPQSSSTH